MADKYGGWCKDEPLVKNREYCIFHAPKGEKGISLEDFNKKIFKKINQTKSEKQLCDLSGTIFEGDIFFSGYHKNNPLPEIDFSFATFSGKVNFFNATFSGGADFYGAIFSGEANFFYATFSGEAEFSFTTFSNEAYFASATFSEKANFYRVKFNGGAYFRGDEKEASKKGLFKKGADFINFSAKEKIRFEGVNLKKVSFLDSDLRNCDFINCEWQEQRNRKVLYEEDLLFGENEKGISVLGRVKRWLVSFKQLDSGQIRKVEILYRRLKQKYTDEHDWPEVSNWHYGEKEMARKQELWGQIFFNEDIFKYKFLQKLLRKFSYDLYWASSGYGERPVRSGAALCVLIIALSFFMWWAGLNPSPDAPAWLKELKDYPKPFDYLLNTLQLVTFQKETILKATSRWGETLVLFARILIPIQTALFVLALRNRFRR